MISPKPFQERYADMHNIVGITPVETFRVFDEDQMLEWHRFFREHKYEGTIIRHTSAGYEDGKRSRSLLKLKDWNDEEFVVTDILESKDGWARLVCVQNNGTTFSVSAPGTMTDKEEVWNNKENYIGRLITVEFAYRTEEGIPFHPIAKAWR
jgi:ATP-dependent DNA ligase